MKQTDIFSPFLSMMIITMIVWVYMYIRRGRYMFKNGIRPGALATPEAVNRALPDEVNGPSNNLKNMFELPVLFYALCLFLFLTGRVNVVYLYSAYIFVIFRAVHSLVHCTVNIVSLRFFAYVISSAALWFMIVKAAVGQFLA